MRLTPLVTVTLAACSLAACASSGGGAAAPPPPVVTPSAQTSTQSAPPPVPAPSTPATAEGAIAFIRAYQRELERAVFVNDATTLDGYSKATCSCRKIDSTIAEERSLKRHWIQSPRIVDQTRTGTTSPGHIEIVMESHWAPSRSVDANGITMESDPGHRATERYSLSREGNQWRIEAIYGHYVVSKSQ